MIIKTEIIIGSPGEDSDELARRAILDNIRKQISDSNNLEIFQCKQDFSPQGDVIANHYICEITVLNGKDCETMVRKMRKK